MLIEQEVQTRYGKLVLFRGKEAFTLLQSERRKFHFSRIDDDIFHPTSDILSCYPGQVLMLQSQLQFERHRREVHAERNRRLLAKAKQGRLVEEELHTMRLQLVQAQNEMAAVRRDAESMRRLRNAAETERAQAVLQFEERTKKMFQELQDISSDRCEREEELLTARDQVRSLRREADRLHAALFTVDAEMKDLRRQANESRRYQQDLKDSQYHLIAARETANLLQQQLMNPSGAVLKYEMEEMTRAYKGSPINIFLNSFQFSVDFCFVLKFQIDLEFCKTFLTGGSVEKTKREVDFAYWFRYFEVNVWNVTRRSGFFF